MRWKTWAKISSVVLFIIAVTGFYYANFSEKEAVLSIENFPSHLQSFDQEEDIRFSFFLYNSGEQTSFVKSIFLERYAPDGSAVLEDTQISPEKDFSVAPGESIDIVITLPPSLNARAYQMTVVVLYEDGVLRSETIPVAWELAR